MWRECFFILLICSLSSVAQSDSSIHGTIRVRLEQKSYVMASTNFRLYYEGPADKLSHSEIMFNRSSGKAFNGSERFITKEAFPKIYNDSLFDYNIFFRQNELTKDIRLPVEEADTVRLLIYVDQEGKVKYKCLPKNPQQDNEMQANSATGNEYKVDLVQTRTIEAFKLLTNFNWNPARIRALKKHPSQEKIKYETKNVCMEGVLTVIYSGFSLQ